MAVTRIKNNQITDAIDGNTQVGVNAAAKLQNYSVTSTKLANSLVYGSDLTVSGNLTVNGTTTAIDTVNTLIEDPIVTLADGQTAGSPTVDIGILGLRGNQLSSFLGWNEANTEFAAILSNTTVSNTTVTINSYANFRANSVLVGGNLSVVGNITGAANFTGNVTAGNLLTPGQVSATGNVAGGNVTTAGEVSATGNVTGGNILFGSGIVSGTGNIYANNIFANISGNIDAAGNINEVQFNGTGDILAASAGFTFNPTGNVLSVNGNVIGANIATAGLITATGNITGGNIITGGNVDATSAFVNAGAVLATGRVEAGTTMSAGGNITGNTNILAGGFITATGNVIGGNLLTGGLITASSNITGANLLTGGSVSATGNVEANNVNTDNVYSSGSLTLTAASGAVVLNPSGNIDASSSYINNVLDPVQAQDAATKQYVDDAVSSGITIHTPVYLETPSALPSATYAQGGNTFTVNQTIAGNTVVFTTAANLQVNDQLWFSNSFEGIVGNTAYFVVSTPNTSAAVLTTTYNGSPVSNITSNTGLTQSVRVNSGIGATLTGAANGALTVDSVAVTNTDRILVYQQATPYENGVYVVTQTGNATAPFILTRSNDTNTYAPASINSLDAGDYFYVQAGATGAGESYVMTDPIGPFIIGYSNLTFTQFSASQVYSANTNAGLSLTGTVFSAKVDNNTTAFDGGGNISVKAGANLTTPNIGAATGTSLSVTGNVTSGNVLTGGIVSASGNVTGGNVDTAGQVVATGNVTGGNIFTGGQISAAGNITANPSSFFIGNGSQLTGVVATSAGFPIVSGTTNIAATFNGNIFFGIGGTSNVLVVANTGIFTTGVSSTSGNVTGGNIDTAGLITATGNVTGGNVLTAGVVTATGNVTGGNIDTAGQVTATGNITGGNISTAGLITATGNILGGNLILAGAAIDTSAGRLTVNSTLADADFAVNGLAANVFYVDAGSNTASFGASTQVANALVNFDSTNSIKLPVGNTAQRPGGTPTTGMLRFNTSLNAVEVYDNSAWTAVGQVVFTVIDDEQFNGDGSTVAFTLGSTQTTNSCIVSINGVVQIPTLAYSVSGTDPTCVLTFTEAPAQGDVIDVRQITTTTTVTGLANGTTAVDLINNGPVNITGNVNPTANLTYSLGNTTNRWANLWVGGNTIHLGNLQLKENPANTFSVFLADGVTQANIDVGNVDVSAITSGTTAIGIAANGNAYVTVNGNANVLVVGNASATVTGALSVTGNITGGNLSAGTGTVTVGNIVNSNANGVGNIGTSSTYFNTVFAKATSAQYADLAEKYAADATYEPGTVVMFGGAQEVTLCVNDACRRVAGVISTNPSYRMNDGLQSAHTAMVALTGRVPTRVTGPVRKGDLMVSAGNGAARAEADPAVGTVIGKALADFDGESGVIEVVVGRV